MLGGFCPISMPPAPFLPLLLTKITDFLSLSRGRLQLPETHLRWELAALRVSSVCTRLRPGTEIAASGQARGGGPAGWGMDFVFSGGL